MTDVLRYAAFTDDPAGGNPAGVVLDAGDLDDAAMLAVAAEVGFSETAFLTPTDTPRTYDVRYFSPRVEVPFCGHATIASGVVLAEREGPGPFVLLTRVGEVAVDTEESVPADETGARPALTATLESVPARSRAATAAEVSALLAALRWRAEDLAPDWPVHVAYAGNEHPVLVTADRDRLADLDYDFDELGGLMQRAGWVTVQLAHPGLAGEWHVRDPFPVGGVVEDPATGAAAAAFGGYLRSIGRARPGERLVLRQGEDMGRPSRLEVEIGPERVRVSGRAVRLPG